MSTSEKLSLKWHDFQENVSDTFSILREDTYFNDVTLACEGGKQVEAHKVILAASSPFFKELFRTNKHAHPLIYMRGMTSQDLLAIVDFLYYGEANIYKDNLDNFLNIARELKLKGLSGGAKANTNGILDESKETSLSQRINISTEKNVDVHNLIPTQEFSDLGTTSSSEISMVIPKLELIGELQELDTKVKSMMAPGDNLTADGKKKAIKCTVCGKEGYQTQIRNHIEANHLQGISLPCTFCEKTFR